MGNSTIDLVGRKGYKHGYIYVGGPGLPSHPPARSHHGPGRSRSRSRSSISRRVQVRHEGVGTHGVYKDGHRIGGVSTVGGGVHYAHLEGVKGTTTHGSLTDAVKHMTRAPRAPRGATRAPSISAKPIGPNMGTLGKAARGNKSLPRGKASETAAGRAAAYKAGHAIAPPKPGAPPGFPITSPRSWDKARQAIGRVKNPQRRAAVAALLRRTAAQYGKTKALKASWAASNTGPALEFAVPDATAFPVSGPLDLVITRDPGDGSAVIRHRRGGGEIGRIRHSDDGQWRAARDGKDLSPHPRQRGALLELIGVHNHAAPSPYRRQPAPAAEPALQPRPVQTDLMKAYGIPAQPVALAGAVPTRGASDGPRVTTGLGPRGQTIYKKLRGRGFPHERAHSFARRAERKAKG